MRMVADAVVIEPVSASNFPANREINREFRRFEANRHLRRVAFGNDSAPLEEKFPNPWNREYFLVNTEFGTTKRSRFPRRHCWKLLTHGCIQNVSLAPRAGQRRPGRQEVRAFRGRATEVWRWIKPRYVRRCLSLCLWS